MATTLLSTLVVEVTTDKLLQVEVATTEKLPLAEAATTRPPVVVATTRAGLDHIEGQSNMPDLVKP